MNRIIFACLNLVRGLIPPLRARWETRGTAAPVTLKTWFLQKVVGFNRNADWPVSPTSRVSGAGRIRIGIGTAPGLSPGCYLQGINGIELGDYSLVGPNVSIVSASHSIYDYFEHEPAGPIRIGAYCWLGANSVVLPGVELGDHTVVAAGAVVTKSFPQGYCVVGGVPAGVIKAIDRSQVVEKRNKHEYIGYQRLTAAR